MAVIAFWDQFLPRTLLFVCSCFSKLLCYSSFRDSSLKPNFITFFPARDTSDPCWSRVSLFCTLGRRLPGVGVYRRDCSESFDTATTPVNIWIRCLKEWVSQDKVIASNIVTVRPPCQIEFGDLGVRGSWTRLRRWILKRGRSQRGNQSHEASRDKSDDK